MTTSFIYHLINASGNLTPFSQAEKKRNRWISQHRNADRSLFGFVLWRALGKPPKLSSANLSGWKSGTFSVSWRRNCPDRRIHHSLIACHRTQRQLGAYYVRWESHLRWSCVPMQLWMVMNVHWPLFLPTWEQQREDATPPGLQNKIGRAIMLNSKSGGH